MPEHRPHRPDLADDVAELLQRDDPRTIAEMIAEDEHADFEVETASRSDDGYTTISFDRGITTSVKGPEVKVGDTVRFYGRMAGSLGGSRHGWALNGTVIEWETPWERAAKRATHLAQYDRRQREDFERERADLDSDYESLPTRLRARIDRFRRKDPAFRVKSERYELFCCTEAAKFARAAEQAMDGSYADDVDAFWAMPVGSRMERGKREAGTVFEHEPDDKPLRWLLWAAALNTATFDYDHAKQTEVLGVDPGHSGNTFGGAIQMARALLAGEPV